MTHSGFFGIILNMADTRNSFQKFLMPQNSVAETFIASILAMVAVFIIFQRGAYGDIWFLYSTYFFICIFLFFSSTAIIIFGNKSKALFKTTQVLGSFIIFVIGVFYAFTLLVISGVTNLHPLDYLFSVFLLITITRFILLYFILVVGKEVDYVFKAMPGIKNDKINLIFILLFLSISLFMFFGNTSVLSVALGRAFFTSVFLIDLLSFIKSRNKKIFVLPEKS